MTVGVSVSEGTWVHTAFRPKQVRWPSSHFTFPWGAISWISLLVPFPRLLFLVVDMNIHFSWLQSKGINQGVQVPHRIIGSSEQMVGWFFQSTGQSWGKRCLSWLVSFSPGSGSRTTSHLLWCAKRLSHTLHFASKLSSDSSLRQVHLFGRA